MSVSFIPSFVPTDSTPAPQPAANSSNNMGNGDLFSALLRNQFVAPSATPTPMANMPIPPAPQIDTSRNDGGDNNSSTDIASSPASNDNVPNDNRTSDGTTADNASNDNNANDNGPSQSTSSTNPAADNSQNDQGSSVTKADTGGDNPPADAASGASNNQASNTHGTSAKEKSDEKNSGKNNGGKDDGESSTQTVGQSNVRPTLLALAAAITPPTQSIELPTGVTGSGSTIGSGTVGKTAAASMPAGSTPQLSVDSNAQTPSLVPSAPNTGSSSSQNGNQNSSQHNDGKPGQGFGQLPAQITVTDDSNTLVSRPSATRAPVSADGMTGSNPQTGNADQNLSPTGQPALAGSSAPAAGNASANPVATMAVDSIGKAGASTPTGSAGSDSQIEIQPQTAANAASTPASSTPASLLQQVTAATGSSTSGEPSAVQTSANELANIANLDQVAVHITKAAGDGLDKISIQLKPESLGRIDVQLQVAHDGHVSAVIGADRQDTLNLLQRDARSLQQALSNAGLRTDAGSLSFNLNSQGQFGTPQSFSNSSPGAANISNAALAESPAPVNVATMTYSSTTANGGVDIRV